MLQNARLVNAMHNTVEWHSMPKCSYSCHFLPLFEMFWMLFCSDETKITVYFACMHFARPFKKNIIY